MPPSHCMVLGNQVSVKMAWRQIIWKCWDHNLTYIVHTNPYSTGWDYNQVDMLK